MVRCCSSHVLVLLLLLRRIFVLYSCAYNHAHLPCGCNQLVEICVAPLMPDCQDVACRFVERLRECGGVVDQHRFLTHHVLEHEKHDELKDTSSSCILAVWQTRMGAI